MSRVIRDRRSWWAALGLAVVAGVVVPLLVLGSSGGDGFTATPYSDVIRFEAAGVARLQVEIFDLSGRRLWDSGIVSGRAVDWNRQNLWGERLAFGTYLYAAQGWNGSGGLIFAKSGKLALMPGDKVQLQQAPTPELPQSPGAPTGGITPPTLGPLAYQYTNLNVSGTLGVGTDAPVAKTDIRGSIFVGDGTGIDSFVVGGRLLSQSRMNTFYNHTAERMGLSHQITTGTTRVEVGQFRFQGVGGNSGFMSFWTKAPTTSIAERMRITEAGNVGIGTISPAGKVDIRNTASQPALLIESSSGTNLIEAHNTGSGTATGLVFRVERATGHVRADGSFYGAGFHTGSADVAEHVNASEVLEPGDVVEIDPDNPQHFRLASAPGSRLVAGVISTEPGVVLGSNADPIIGDIDPRPVLALAGRVPVKATAENGPIQPGDMLISASTPGYAMRCADPASAVGAVIGKALEPLDEGAGLIMMQVTLR